MVKVIIKAPIVVDFCPLLGLLTSDPKPCSVLCQPGEEETRRLLLSRQLCMAKHTTVLVTCTYCLPLLAIAEKIVLR